MKKVAQINSTVKVSSTFSKVAGSRGGAPRRCSAIVNKVYCEIPLFQKNGARGEKCESISRGGVGEVCFTRSPSPFYIPKQTYPPKRSGGTFWTKQLPRTFIQFAQGQYLFRQTELPIKNQKLFFIRVSALQSLHRKALL